MSIREEDPEELLKSVSWTSNLSFLVIIMLLFMFRSPAGRVTRDVQCLNMRWSRVLQIFVM